MSTVSPEVKPYSREDTLHKNTELIPVPIFPKIPEIDRAAVEKAEHRALLARQAANLAVAVGVSTDQAIQEREVNRFLQAAGYKEDSSNVAGRQAFVLEIISRLQDQVRTETAAAALAQNEVLRTQNAGLKDALMAQPPEVLLKYAHLLKTPARVELHVEEFVSQIRDAVTTAEVPHLTPTTDELETALTHVTDETMSPARGISIRAMSKRALTATVRFFTQPSDLPVLTGDPTVDEQFAIR